MNLLHFCLTSPFRTQLKDGMWHMFSQQKFYHVNDLTWYIRRDIHISQAYIKTSVILKTLHTMTVKSKSIL